MKNGSLEFLIQNSRSPHKHWLYGPCIYIGQMFWWTLQDSNLRPSARQAKCSPPATKLS